MTPDEKLDRLFIEARSPNPAIDRLEFGFTTRLQARLRAEQPCNFGCWAFRLAPLFATIAVVLGIFAATDDTDLAMRTALSTPDTWPELAEFDEANL
jgi:hypothetical protein